MLGAQREDSIMKADDASQDMSSGSSHAPTSSCYPWQTRPKIDRPFQTAQELRRPLLSGSFPHDIAIYHSQTQDSKRSPEPLKIEP